MRRLNLIIPKTIDTAIKNVFIEIQNWANNIREISPDQLSGDIPVDKLKLYRGMFSPSLVNFGEWYIPLALPADDYISFDTEFSRCSGVFLFDPDNFPPGKWYFEASMAISNASRYIYVRLQGDGKTIVTLSRTGSTEIQVVRSGVLNMPTVPANLYVEMRTNNTQAQASFGGARLVFVPD